MERACAGWAELERLAEGGEASAGVRAHVETCARCRRQVEEIRENLAFLGARAGGLARAFDAANAEAPSGPPLPPGLVPGYELLGEIGRGGQGVVYRAVQTATKRQAALKMLLGGALATERQRARFEREIEIAARLRHPGIVTVFESGRTLDGRPYVAMEYVEGTPIEAYIRERYGAARGAVRDRVDAVMRLMRMIASAVGHAHGAGVMHRDLKPSNILVDGRGTPRILDFGLARAVETASGASMTAEFAGTPAFSAPEQFAGGAGSASPATDVYALGLLAYHGVTGAMPYPVEVPIAEAARIVMSAEPVPPSRHVPGLPGDVETIILKCLSKDPGRRYANGDALEADIGDYLAGRPISARRDSAWYMVSMFARRHTAPTVAGVLVAMTVVGAAIGLGLLARDLDAARRGAEAALAASTLQRARLMGAAGSTEHAEALLWSEARRAGMDAASGLGASPEARRAAWALTELYAGLPRAFRASLEHPHGSIGFADDGRLWMIDARGRRSWWSARGEPLPSTAWERAEAEFARSSRNGRYVVACDAGEVRVLDLDARRVVSGPRPWPDGDGSKIRISDDGRLIASVRGLDGVAVLTDARTLAPLGEFEPGTGDVALDRRGDRSVLLILGSRDGSQRIVVRESPGWEVRCTIELRDTNGTVREPVIIDGGASLVVGFNENLRVFGLADGRPDPMRHAVLRAHVNSIRVDEERGLLAAGSMEGTMALLRLGDFSPVAEVRNGRPGSVALSRDGRRAAYVDGARRVSVYEVSPREWLGRIESSPGTHASIAVGPGGAAAWTDDAGELFIRDAAPPHGIRRVRAHEGVVTSVDWSPDGSRILTAGFDGAVREWNADGTAVRTVIDGPERLWRARYGPDGRSIAVGDGDARVRVWRDGGDTEPMAFGTGGDRVPDVEFGADGRLLACASIKHGCFVWDLEAGREKHRLGGHGEFLRAVAFAPDGRTIATGGDDRAVRLWETASGRLLHAIEGLPWGPYDLAFHPTGRLLLAAGRGPEVVVLDPEAGAELATIRVHERHIFSLAFDPSGRRLFTSGQDPWIGVTDLDHLLGYVRGNLTHGMERAGPASIR